MPKALPTLLTIRQAADQLQFCDESVRRAVVRGDLIAHRVGGAIRISQADLDAFVKAGRGVRIKPHRHKETVS